MRDARRTADALFRAICLGFSALLLVLSLLTEAHMTAVSDRAAQMKTEIAALKTENEVLLARCESRVSLETLEKYAREELGLQPCRSDQLRFLSLK